MRALLLVAFVVGLANVLAAPSFFQPQEQFEQLQQRDQRAQQEGEARQDEEDRRRIAEQLSRQFEARQRLIRNRLPIVLDVQEQPASVVAVRPEGEQQQQQQQQQEQQEQQEPQQEQEEKQEEPETTTPSKPKGALIFSSRRKLTAFNIKKNQNGVETDTTGRILTVRNSFMRVLERFRRSAYGEAAPIQLDQTTAGYQAVAETTTTTTAAPILDIPSTTAASYGYASEAAIATEAPTTTASYGYSNVIETTTAAPILLDVSTTAAYGNNYGSVETTTIAAPILDVETTTAASYGYASEVPVALDTTTASYGYSSVVETTTPALELPIESTTAAYGNNYGSVETTTIAVPILDVETTTASYGYSSVAETTAAALEQAPVESSVPSRLQDYNPGAPLSSESTTQAAYGSVETTTLATPILAEAPTTASYGTHVEIDSTPALEETTFAQHGSVANYGSVGYINNAKY